MNRRERFERYLAGQPVDRVPLGFWHHYCWYTEMGTGLTDQAMFEKNVEGHRLSKQIFEPDIVKIMTDSLITLPLDLSAVSSVSDLKNIEPISVHSEYVQKNVELVSRVRDMYDDDVPIFTTGFTPLFPLRNALTDGLLDQKGLRFLAYFKEDPEAVADALAILGEGIMEMHRYIITQCGIDGIYFSVNNRNHYLPDNLYRKYISPSEKAVLDDANRYARTNLLHICGSAGQSNNLEIFRDYNAAAFNWSIVTEGVSLAEGREFFKKPVFGGFEQTGVLYNGTPEEVEEFTFRLLDESGQTGIMLGADCTLPLDIDEKRYHWVKQAAEKYAQQHPVG